MSGSYKVAWLCEALLVSAQWLLRLEGAASEAWSTPGREQFFAPTHPGRVPAQSADLWQSTALPCLVVKVATQENTSSSAAAGVMIRDTTDPSSKHASMLSTPGNGVFFQRRLATGGATSQTILAGARITASYWMKLVRSGDTLTGYWSSTGTSWSPLGSDTISMGANVLIGVVVTSGASTVSSTATFTDLDIVPESTSAAQPFQ